MKGKIKLVLYSLLNSVCFFVIFFLLQKVYFLSEIDNQAFRSFKLIEDLLFTSKPDSIDSRVLLINTSFDNILIDYYDEFGNPNGNIPITNRQSLANFFQRLKENPVHEYAICDIFFDLESPYDSVLFNVLDQPKLIIAKSAIHKIPESKKLNFGNASITTVDNMLFKFSLRKNNNQSLSEKVFESVTHENIDIGILWSTHADKKILNDFLPEFWLTNYELKDSKTLPVLNLQDIQQLPDEFLKKLIKDRIVIVSDFNDGDIKNTIVGNMPGGLIHLNIVFTLLYGKTELTIWFFVYLFSLFFLMSLLVIYPQDQLEKLLSRIPYIGGVLLFTSYVLMMMVISFSTYLIFGLKLSFGLIGFLFYVENVVFSFKYYYNKSKENLKALKPIK